MTMKRRTTGQLPALARSNWNTVKEMSELDEDSLMEEKAAQLKILKHGEHQSHPLSLVRLLIPVCLCRTSICVCLLLKIILGSLCDS